MKVKPNHNNQQLQMEALAYRPMPISIKADSIAAVRLSAPSLFKVVLLTSFPACPDQSIPFSMAGLGMRLLAETDSLLYYPSES